MALSSEQLKGRIRNIAKECGTDARILIRIYMMERFLERVAKSKYSEKFVIKGGVLVTSMLGISMRSTMDIDASVRNIDLSIDEAERIAREIASIDIDDGVSFKILGAESIMDDMEYPGIRISIDAAMERVSTPIKLDISTGDAITPRAVQYDYKLMLEDRSIKLWSYNLETILAEKLQTILARGILNTRMRDFYDIRVLLLGYGNLLNEEMFRSAFEATCDKRGSNSIAEKAGSIVDDISCDSNIQHLWESYRQKYPYAEETTFDEVITSIKGLVKVILHS